MDSIKSKAVWGKLKKFLMDKEPFKPFSNPSSDLFVKSEYHSPLSSQLSELWHKVASRRTVS